MFCTLTFDRGLRFGSGLLVLKFTAAVGVFTWAYIFVFFDWGVLDMSERCSFGLAQTVPLLKIKPFIPVGGRPLSAGLGASRNHRSSSRGGDAAGASDGLAGREIKRNTLPELPEAGLVVVSEACFGWLLQFVGHDLAG